LHWLQSSNTKSIQLLHCTCTRFSLLQGFSSLYNRVRKTDSNTFPNAEHFSKKTHIFLFIFWKTHENKFKLVKIVLGNNLYRVFPPYITGSGKRTVIPFPMLSTFPPQKKIPIFFIFFRKTHENRFELVKIVLGTYFRYQKFNYSLWNLLNAIFLSKIWQKTTQIFPNGSDPDPFPMGRGKTLLHNNYITIVYTILCQKIVQSVRRRFHMF